MRTVTLLFCTLLCGLVRSALCESSDPEELEKLRAGYLRKSEEVVKPLKKRYVADLQSLEKAVTDRGRIEEALKIREERLRVALGKATAMSVLTRLPKEPESLARVASVFERRATSALRPWESKYERLLVDLESKLRGEGRLEDALKVKNALKALRQAPEEKGSTALTTRGGTFNGRDQYVTFGKLPDAFNEDTMSFSAFIWVKGESRDGLPAVFGVVKSEDGERSWLMQQGKNHLDIIVYGGRDQRHRKYYRIANVFDGKWHHCGFTFEEGSLDLFLDGKPYEAGRLEDSEFTEIHRSSKARLMIGARDSGGGTASSPFRGQLRGAVIYSSNIRASDVQKLFKKGSFGEPFLSIPLNEGKGSRAGDVSGNGHHGKIVNLSKGFWPSKEG